MDLVVDPLLRGFPFSPPSQRGFLLKSIDFISSFVPHVKGR